MNLLLRAVFILLASLAFLPAGATHIVGGEMNYRYLGNNQYEISLTVYRDCYYGQASFDNPASIGIFDGANNLVASSLVYIHDQQQVPNAINTPCLVPPVNVCYEVANYYLTTTLLPRPGGYTIVYQRCCRNNSILNLENVNHTGATYLATIPDSGLLITNSNPVFNQWPPTFICQNAPFTFDHSATDPDGDSLVYELYTPLSGADNTNPMPQPPSPPPYDSADWAPPYGLSNPLGGVPLRINRFTGQLTATPVATGQYVYGIRVMEFRNGIYLGSTLRDFQVNVVPCPDITVASIFSPTIVCGSTLAQFVNTSFNAATYQWDFGDPVTAGDTSTQMNPEWNYPDTGTYFVTLIAFSGIDTDCNDTASGVVKVYPPFHTGFEISNDHCSPYFLFQDHSAGSGGTPALFWSWNFGDGYFSGSGNPSHTYLQPGQYTVTLISSKDSSCTDTASIPVNVLRIPVASFLPFLDTCSYTLGLHNQSLYSSSYIWDFGDLSSGTAFSPEHVYADFGVYTVQLNAVSDSGCVNSSTAQITIPPLPLADFAYSVATCDSVVSFSNHSIHASDYFWDLGDHSSATVSDPVHTYQISGTVPVRMIATSSFGCTDTVDRNIDFVSFKNAEFKWALDTCSGVVRFTDVTRNAVNYLWNFGDGTTSNEISPVHSYSVNGEFEVTLMVNGESACMDSIHSITKFESPLGELFFAPNAFTPNGDGLNDDFRISLFRPCDTYSLNIFNRWGQEVFSSGDAANAVWDGTFHGAAAEQGVYVYLLKGGGMDRNGVVYLIR